MSHLGDKLIKVETANNVLLPSSSLSTGSIMAEGNGGMQRNELLNAFRAQYQHFVTAIPNAVQSSADPVVLARLGEDLNEYYDLTQQVRHVPSQQWLIAEYFSMGVSSLQMRFRC